jgi:hypothetical protein
MIASQLLCFCFLALKVYRALLLNTDLLDSDLLKSGLQTQIVECAISPFLLLHLCEFCRANGVRVAFGVCYCFLR